MKKSKFLILFAALVCLVTALCVTASANVYGGDCGAEGDNVTWVLNTDTGKLTISGTGAMKDYDSALSTPWYLYNNLYGRIETVVIEKGVTHIGALAFSACDDLTKITIPNSVTSIGDGAFFGCRGLQNKVGDLIYIKTTDNPYYYLCGVANTILNTYTISNRTRFIGGGTGLSGAFSGLSKLTSITIPDSVISISDGAFFNCKSLTSVTIPNSVKIIDNAFGCCSSLTSITIPNGVEIIDNAFWGCSSLTSVTIPNSVKSMDGAFGGCSSLTSITIPGSVKSMNGAFGQCYSLINQETYFCNSLVSVTIQNGVPNIGEGTFSGCSSLASITIPNSVTSIGDSAFRDCSSLTSITIPSSVTSIGDSAFWNCSSLTSIVIPEGVTAIGEKAFWGCKALTSATLPGSLKSFGWNDAYYLGHVDVFGSCDSLTTVTLKEGLKCIFGEMFSGCSALTSITIPESVTSIERNAFSGCSSLTSVTIPESVTSIGRYAFDDCSSLTSVTIPESVTSIEDYAFPRGTTIRGAAGSAAEQYAGKYGYVFVPFATYTVSFETDGGSIIAPQNIRQGKQAEKPESPVKNGFVFAGWYADPAYTLPFDFASIFMDLTAYAKWIPSEQCIVMTIDSTEATVFGKPAKTDVAPIIVNDRTMLPARFVAEALGADVVWDAAARKATITGNGVTIEIYIDSATAYINGNAVTLDSPAFIRGDRTYTPVRFVAEALGATVSWDAADRQAILVK